MAFASFVMYHKIHTELAFSTDHTMCICYDGEKVYLCDPSSGNIWKMNGKITDHDEYGWYQKVSDDEFRFNYLVVRSVEYGGFYAIIKTFEYLSNKPWDHTVHRANDDMSYDAA
jgi:hypothetical protein